MADPAENVARIILRRQRRLADHGGPNPCRKCFENLASSVRGQLADGGPLRMLLPAFPVKSPNPEKVLGQLPDMGEELALRSLDEMCEDIRRHYGPGAGILICSDGRVFSDSVGVTDHVVTEYQRGMRSLAERLRLDSISLFSLDDVYPGLSYRDMRLTLMFNHGERIQSLRDAVSGNDDIRQMYRGITRFLYEDADRSDSILTNSALRRDCRRRAYDVMARSQAWSRLLECHFPDAIRLSIHPHPCGSKKIGIHLTSYTGGDQWLTPWHAVAVRTPEGYRFMKRRAAEAAGAVLVYQSAQPHHYTLVGDSRHETTPHSRTVLGV